MVVFLKPFEIYPDNREARGLRGAFGPKGGERRFDQGIGKRVVLNAREVVPVFAVEGRQVSLEPLDDGVQMRSTSTLGIALCRKGHRK